MTSPTPEGQRVAGEQTCASVEEAISKAFAARGGAVRFMPDGTVRYVPIRGNVFAAHHLRPRRGAGMSMPTVDHHAFQQAYADALKHGSGFYETRLFDRVNQFRQVPYSDVFRFRFIPGKSHAHSRKIWRERSRRTLGCSSVRVTYELPEPLPDPAPVVRQLLNDMAARIDRAIWDLSSAR